MTARRPRFCPPILPALPDPFVFQHLLRRRVGLEAFEQRRAVRAALQPVRSIFTAQRSIGKA